MAWGQRRPHQGPVHARPTTASWTLTPAGNGSVHVQEILTSIGSNVCFC